MPNEGKCNTLRLLSALAGCGVICVLSYPGCFFRVSCLCVVLCPLVSKSFLLACHKPSMRSSALGFISYECGNGGGKNIEHLAVWVWSLEFSSSRVHCC